MEGDPTQDNKSQQVAMSPKIEAPMSTEGINRRVSEIAKKEFCIDYVEEIVKEGETPESFIFNGRRILRSTIQTLVDHMVKSGMAQKRENGYDSKNANLMYELDVVDPKCQQFVDALNIVIRQYDNLMDGSNKINSPSVYPA